MLKKNLLVAWVGILLVSQNVQAGDAAQNGAWGGAAGGALLGQAIGRNTKGTLLGTAIGGGLGYMVGNEMDKEQTRTGQGYSPQPAVVQQYEAINNANCQEVEVLAEVDGRPERVYSTACYENGAWVLQNSGRVVSQTVIINRDHYYPQARGVHYPPWERHRWQESRYRPMPYGYFGRGRGYDNNRFIFR